MSQATLGTPYRSYYLSKNYVSGLTGIYAQVRKPDGSIAGNFPLVESSGTMYAGTYWFDLYTLSSDPAGEWLVMAYSPTENYRAFEKITYVSTQVSGNPWSYPIAGNQVPGTFGYFVVNALLTVAKFLGLK